MTASLELRQLAVSVSKKVLVHPIDLQVNAGEWLTIIGPNGAGKSTLLRAIVGASDATGETLVDGTSLASMDRRERGRHIAWVPQNPVIPAGFLVYDYIMLGRTPHRHLLAAERPQDLEVVHAVLADLDLEAFADRDVASLSGGERQRVVIGRALAQQAPILLLDEPTTALDLGHQQDVLLLLNRLREQGQTIVSTMHDLTLAGQFADRLVLLAQGRVAAHGSAVEVITEQNLAEHYNACVHVTYDDGVAIVVPHLRPPPHNLTGA